MLLTSQCFSPVLLISHQQIKRWKHHSMWHFLLLKCVQCTPISLGKLVGWLISLTLWRLQELISGIIFKCLFSSCSCWDTFIFTTHFRRELYLKSDGSSWSDQYTSFCPTPTGETCSCPRKYAAWGQDQRFVSRNLYLNPRTLNLTICYETLSFTN